MPLCKRDVDGPLPPRVPKRAPGSESQQGVDNFSRCSAVRCLMQRAEQRASARSDRIYQPVVLLEEREDARLLAGIRNRGYSVKFTGENRA
jgi:hypothetical protein